MIQLNLCFSFTALFTPKHLTPITFFVLHNIPLFQLWKTKSVKSHFLSISAVESATTAPPSPAFVDAGRCDVCRERVRVWKRMCINLLSSLILQSYQEKWQAQMSRRSNYCSVNKCVCVIVYVCVCVCLVLGGGRVVGGGTIYSLLMRNPAVQLITPSSSSVSLHTPQTHTGAHYSNTHIHTHQDTCN